MDGGIRCEKLHLEGEEIDLYIHRADSNAVLIMYPGADGSIDGYSQKYYKIAELVRSKNIATVIRLDNRYCCIARLPYCDSMVVKLAYVLENIFDEPERFTGHKNVRVYLSGVSAGASSIATVLNDFPYIEKILFIAPANIHGEKVLQEGLKNYSGEVYLAAGSEDEIGAFKIARFYHDSCVSASKRLIEIIPDCDHQFRGKKNGMILANAFLWAFAGEGNFPDAEDGIVLYE